MILNNIEELLTLIDCGKSIKINLDEDTNFIFTKKGDLILVEDGTRTGSFDMVGLNIVIDTCFKNQLDGLEVEFYTKAVNETLDNNTEEVPVENESEKPVEGFVG